MAKTREQKKQMLDSYKDSLSEATGIIVISQEGLTPDETNDFKKRLFELDSNYQVVKNTLFKIALEESELPAIEEFNSGPSSVVYTSEDVASIAKAVTEFAKEYKDKVTVKAGILDGQKLTIEQVNELSEMPTKDQSVAMIAGILELNVSGIANVLQDSVKSVAIILDKAFAE